jgi:hypothetical protein
MLHHPAFPASAYNGHGSGPPGSLHLQSSLCGLGQKYADLAAREAHIIQFPIAETSQNDKIGLALAVRDHDGNPTIDEAGNALQKPCEYGWNCARGRRIAWGTI